MPLVSVNGFAGHQPRRNAADAYIKYVPKYNVAHFIFFHTYFLLVDKKVLLKEARYILNSNNYSNIVLQVT